MDNEASTDLKNCIVKHKISYQLTPPNMHRINALERAIRTFKNHFLAGLATIDPKFPIREWDRLLPQAELTLNLLRNTRLNPKISAHEAIYGSFDFNRTPMAPPGTKVVIHDKSTKRASWAYHGQMGFYIGPALEHYRCMHCYIPTTKQERIADTIQFFPQKIAFPTLTLNEHLMYALDKIVTILQTKNLTKSTNKLLIDDKTLQALEFITSLLQKMSPTLSDDTSTPTQGQDISQIPIPKLPAMPAFNISQEQVNDKHSMPPETNSATLPRVPQTQIKNVTDTKREQLLFNLKNIFDKHLQHRTTKRAKLLMLKKVMHIYDDATGKRLSLRTLLQDPSTKDTWARSSSNEYGRLLAGNQHGIIGTNTMKMIHPTAIAPKKISPMLQWSMITDY